MKVTMRTLSAGPSGAREIGKTYEVPDDEAKDLIKGGYAVPVDRSTKVARAERAVGESGIPGPASVSTPAAAEATKRTAAAPTSRKPAAPQTPKPT